MKKDMKISGKELVINSSEKLGRHLDNVKSGCGFHNSNKYSKQDRKKGKVDIKNY